MTTDNEQIIRDFVDAWSRRDADELLGFLAEDAVYHNMPMQPVQGHDAIRAVFDFFLPGSTAITWDLLHMASSGDVVFTERVDRFSMGDREVALPVAGVFEVADGKITAWRDYFDMAAWTSQAG
ncbi:MAG TPA: limonene-1,2-epoxide hydrolase family protein [Acidimicrobiia bacterium]|nr:limonene-1,2-epoxide hydrolase family protein [Acidimicrobiia bacterium]